MLRVINIICIFLVIVLVAFALESLREHNRFCIKEYTIRNTKLPASFDGTKTVLIADWHNTSFGKENARFIETVQQLNPDFIFIAGDMIVCKRHTEEKVKKTAKLVKKLSQIAPVYYGYGNHEYGLREGSHHTGGIWDIYMNELDLKNNANIIMLDNKSEVISRGGDRLCISGLTLEHDYFKRFFIKHLDKKLVTDVFGKVENAYNILLAHNPDYFDTYVEAGADLVLSGHNHGGMIRIPFLGGIVSPRFHLFPKYDRGRYDKDRSAMILSGGLGTHSVPVRVNNVPELVVVQLHNDAK